MLIAAASSVSRNSIPNHLGKALAMYVLLLKVDPKRFESHFTGAVSLQQAKGVTDDAISWAAEIAKKYPRQPAVPVWIANTYSAEDKYAKAAEHYAKAIPLMKRYTDKLSLYFRLIDAQIRAKQYSEAEESCRAALSLKIQSAVVRRKLESLLRTATSLRDKSREK